MSRDLGETRPLPSMTDMDPDALFRCPYDPSHIICAKRYTYHVAKCSLTNKKVAQNMRTCPFNARHRILKSNMAEHLAQCPDRRTVGQTEVTQGAVRAERGDGHSSVPQSSGEVQPCQEDWDADRHQTCPSSPCPIICCPRRVATGPGEGTTLPLDPVAGSSPPRLIPRAPSTRLATHGQVQAARLEEAPLGNKTHKGSEGKWALSASTVINGRPILQML
ncbi:uncharacterized protein LOC144938615 isoform X1 [Lampetra fluviatilis]